MTTLFPLKLTTNKGCFIQQWINFVDVIHAHESLTTSLSVRNVSFQQVERQLFQQHLAIYQAHTNLEDLDDPVWFESQEEMMRFLLEWS